MVGNINIFLCNMEFSTFVLPVKIYDNTDEYDFDLMMSRHTPNFTHLTTQAMMVLILVLMVAMMVVTVMMLIPIKLREKGKIHPYGHGDGDDIGGDGDGDDADPNHG